jgi:hypothetical protein
MYLELAPASPIPTTTTTTTNNYSVQTDNNKTKVDEDIIQALQKIMEQAQPRDDISATLLAILN